MFGKSKPDICFYRTSTGVLQVAICIPQDVTIRGAGVEFKVRTISVQIQVPEEISQAKQSILLTDVRHPDFHKFITKVWFMIMILPLEIQIAASKVVPVGLYLVHRKPPNAE